MTTTKIEWAATPNSDGTLKPGRSDWNPVRGCTRVSPGCGGPGPHGGCYAEGIASRFSGPGLAFHGFAEKVGGKPHWTGRVEVMWDRLTDPLKWREPATIFALSMSDLFHEKLLVHEIATIYAVMVAAVHVRRHTFQVLTKRSGRMREILNSAAFWKQVNAEAGAHVMECTDVFNRMRGDARTTLDEYGPNNPPPGIWLGVSVESQKYADERIPDLLATPAAIRFLSCEPLLGPLDLSPWLWDNPGHGKQTQRRIRLPSDSERRPGNPTGRDDLATSQEGMGSLEEMRSQPSLQTSESGTRLRGILSGSDHDRRGENLRPSTSPGLEAPEGADPRPINDQSPRRSEEAQSSGQLGAGDSIRAVVARDSRAEGWESGGSERREEPRRETNVGSSERHSGTSFSGRAVVDNRCGLRDSVSNGLENSAWRPTIKWIIDGGESGPNARPSHPDWHRSLRDQCAAAEVPYFFKQWGEFTDIDHVGDAWNTMSHAARGNQQFLNGTAMIRVGKKAAGALLDGRAHREMPNV